MSALLCDWKELANELPPTKDEYYLFGGYDTNGKFNFDSYHYSLNGTINGWSVKTALINGNRWWCMPNEPDGT